MLWDKNAYKYCLITWACYPVFKVNTVSKILLILCGITNKCILFDCYKKRELDKLQRQAVQKCANSIWYDNPVYIPTTFYPFFIPFLGSAFSKWYFCNSFLYIIFLVPFTRINYTLYVQYCCGLLWLFLYVIVFFFV
jgi:hypothetical protein